MCETMKHYNSTQPTLTKHYIHGSLYPYFFPTSYMYYMCTHTYSHYLLLPLCVCMPAPSPSQITSEDGSRKIEGKEEEEEEEEEERDLYVILD